MSLTTVSKLSSATALNSPVNFNLLFYFKGTIRPNPTWFKRDQNEKMLTPSCHLFGKTNLEFEYLYKFELCAKLFSDFNKGPRESYFMYLRS